MARICRALCCTTQAPPLSPPYSEHDVPPCRLLFQQAGVPARSLCYAMLRYAFAVLFWSRSGDCVGACVLVMMQEGCMVLLRAHCLRRPHGMQGVSE